MLPSRIPLIYIPLSCDSIGDLRLRLPVANDPYDGTYNATAFSPACTQQNATSEADFLALPPETLEFLVEHTANVGAGAEDCKGVPLECTVEEADGWLTALCTSRPYSQRGYPGGNEDEC